MHSKEYRFRYADLLQTDFPRVPFTTNEVLFYHIKEIGKKLVQNHLLDDLPLQETVSVMVGVGNNSINSGYPKYEGETIWFNSTQGFKYVEPSVWEFRIGGYQALEKWLKDRRGRQLSAEDIAHYQKMIVAIQETILLMGEIDAVIKEHGGWPIQ